MFFANSNLSSCLNTQIGIQKYNFTKIAVVSKNPDIRANASLFFKEYVFKINEFPDFWEVDEFDSMDDLFGQVSGSPNQSYCFGLNFIENNIDKENNIYDVSVEYSFNKGMIPDTNAPPYDPDVMSPDMFSWKLYMRSAAVVYPYISEFICRYIKMNVEDDSEVMSQMDPLFGQTVAYAPMTT